jgi:hypothetical protein
MMKPIIMFLLLLCSVVGVGQVLSPSTLAPTRDAGNISSPIQVEGTTQQQNSRLIGADKPLQAGQQSSVWTEITQEMPNQPVQYVLPSDTKKEGTDYYRKALDTISRMLRTEYPLNLRQAVFLTENAYYGKPVYFDWFSFSINEYTNLIKKAVVQKGYDWHNPTAKKWGIQHFLSDTIRLKDEAGKVVLTNLPFSYDFNDSWGKEDWTQQFVSKLTNQHKGQCHSMPLLYLILAEALEVEAWLSCSPSHTFIKVKDKKGNLLNYETTNGHYTTDVWIQSSGFIKAEALRSKIYMDTMSKKEVIATCLADLAKGYIHKYGFDPFVLECTQTALKYSPNNVYALQIQADYQTYLFSFVINQLGRPPVATLPNYPQAYELYQKMHQSYEKLDAIGYEAMPEDIYAAWLKSFEAMKNKQPIPIIQP